MMFGSRDGAEAAGYRPCTTCRPDLHPLGEAT
jgi:methylphosphotriester-DNA--protein-cysteine methyltransferase